MSELKQERLGLRLSQAQAAQRMGVTSNTWARWEREEMAMGEPYLRLWARVAMEAGQEVMHAAQAVRESVDETE